ncbi:MAG: FAD-dependent oxidoreductase, partial [Verrucomicrobia bacterium]|nr:FAD-dependent oxidoreductase [Verrucomicrobiota bacterium]
GQPFDRLVESHARVHGVVPRDGTRFEADQVVMAVGSWTPHVLPWLGRIFRSNGMPIFHLNPANPGLFTPPHFVVFLADEPVTGYYGLPLHPENNVVIFAYHGPGREMHPESPERQVTAEEIEKLRQFLRYTCPSLADAPMAYTRLCLYCDTWDGHFWLAHDPERPGLVVATGGSGHAFKFAPVLGGFIADTVEQQPYPYAQKFRWRPELTHVPHEEQLRHKE